jgi:hypothetical protein
VRQAVAREAAKGKLKWEPEVLQALSLTTDDVIPLSETDAQQLFAKRVAEMAQHAAEVHKENVCAATVR